MPGLTDVLEEAKHLGFLGPGPVQDHLAHAQELIELLDGPPSCYLDLGSGGGLPGLVLATSFPAAHGVLLDASDRRTAFLERAVRSLEFPNCEVVTARAEDEGRDPRLRGQFDLVVARSFGPPAVVAECAAPFLAVGGTLVVSEPPASAGDRWPAAGLAPLGLQFVGVVGRDHRFAVLDQVAPCPDAYPRRSGVPSRKPLFS